jgi:PncC family amidohydrolase
MIKHLRQAIAHVKTAIAQVRKVVARAAREAGAHVARKVTSLLLLSLVSKAEIETQSKARKLHNNFLGNKEADEKPKTWTIAESCPGGMASSGLVSIPHDSENFEMSAVVYSERAKERICGISPALVSQDSMYSEECAQSMAIGVRNWAGSDFGFSITGVTGPDAGKPNASNARVGMVFYGFTDGATTKSSWFFYDRAAELYAQAKTDEEICAVRLHVMRVFTDEFYVRADAFVTERRQEEALQKQARELRQQRENSENNSSTKRKRNSAKQ